MRTAAGNSVSSRVVGIRVGRMLAFGLCPYSYRARRRDRKFPALKRRKAGESSTPVGHKTIANSWTLPPL